VLGLLVTAGAVLVTGCSRDTQSGEQRRRDVDESVARRSAGDRAADSVVRRRSAAILPAARRERRPRRLRAACATCHEGRTPPPGSEQPSAVCIDCHASSHEPIQACYAGAVRGVAVPADTMFLARVSCVGCHSDTTFTAPVGAARNAALDGMCTSCHGRRFGGMLAMWRNGVEWRTQAVSAYVAQAVADPRLAGDAARARVRVARDAMQLLRTVGALHNVRGADQLFRAALDSTTAAYRRAGVAAPARPALGPDPASNECLGCHYGVESARTTIYDQKFDHASHVVRADVACKDCHSAATYFAGAKSGATDQGRAVDAKHGKTTLTAASCESCHHSPTTKVGCTACHAGDERLKKSVRVVMALKLAGEGADKSHRRVPACAAREVELRELPHGAGFGAQHRAVRVVPHRSSQGTRIGLCVVPYVDHAGHAHDGHPLQVRHVSRAGDGRQAAPRSCLLRELPREAGNHEPGRECSPCHLHLSPSEVRRRMLAAEAARPAPPRRPDARPTGRRSLGRRPVVCHGAALSRVRGKARRVFVPHSLARVGGDPPVCEHGTP
jgi:hypothetical protein